MTEYIVMQTRTACIEAKSEDEAREKFYSLMSDEMTSDEITVERA